MWNAKTLEKRVAKALECIGKGAAALSEAGQTVYNLSNAMQHEALGGVVHLDARGNPTGRMPSPAHRSREGL